MHVWGWVMDEFFVKAGGWCVMTPDVAKVDPWPSYQERLENGDCDDA
jgi:hypothetical protein